MPLTRIEIEQLEGRRWVAEAEYGGLSVKRVVLRGHDFHEIMADLIRAHDELAEAQRQRDADRAAAAAQEAPEPKPAPEVAHPDNDTAAPPLADGAPFEPRQPISKRKAAQMRAAADERALAAASPETRDAILARKGQAASRRG